MKRFFNICLCVCLLVLVACVNDGKVKGNAIDNTPSQEKGVLMLNVGTRATDGTERDYILSIYKNEAGKAMLVRKYDSSKAEMQKPEYIWLLEGNYTATVESGVKVSATFNEPDKHFFGEQSFDIKGGETTTVDIVAITQNISVEVIFDQSITEGFHEGYSVEVKAADDTALTYTESKKGYFIMPEGVNTLNWHFVGTFEYEDGEQVEVDRSGLIENVAPKRAYKLSFKFSPDASGLFGGLTATLDESIEERDDHLSFSPDPELRGVGFDINAHCNYAGGERKYLATAAAEFVGVTLAVGDTMFDPVATPVAGITLSGLNTAQLYISLTEDFFYSLNGGNHIIEMIVTDSGGSEARKELSYSLPGVSGYDKNNEVLVWTGCSTKLSATVFGSPSSVEILCREGEEEWKRNSASAGEDNLYSVVVDGLTPNHTYEYALSINGKMVGSPLTFTLSNGNQIPNGGMEDWSSSGKVAVPYHFADEKASFWCTGNWGAADYVGNITSSNSDVRPGSSGKRSAFLDSTYAIVKFAAGNLYVGAWGGMDGINAKVYFGQPFEFNAKPKAIRFWAKWKCGIINREATGKGKKGDPDLTKIFCCLCNWTAPHMVHSGKAESTTFSPSDANIKSGDARYNGVLYSAYLDTTESREDWHLVEIPFTFYGTDPNEVPNHIVLTFTCSGYGDFFDGSEDSWMYVDDIELVY